MSAPASVRAAAPPAFGRFFLPGPTDVHPDVLAAMARPMIGHRSSAMEEPLPGMGPRLAALARSSYSIADERGPIIGRGSEERKSELPSHRYLVCRLPLEKKKR